MTPSQVTVSSDEFTIAGLVPKIVIETRITDGFTGTLIIKENGVRIDDQFTCLDCTKGDTVLINFRIDGDDHPDCKDMCEFRKRKLN